MNFSFSLNDFLNEFSAGFIFVFGIVITNLNCFANYFDYAYKYIVLIIILMYITGLIISSIGYFINMPFYQFIDKLIRKIKIKPINKFFYFLKMVTFYLFFRRWTVVETFIRVNRKEKLPQEISHLKEYDELAILTDKILEKSKTYAQGFFFKSQFFQSGANSILLTFLLNLITRKGQMHLKESLIYLGIFFFLKSLSPVFAKNYFLDISRKASALNLIDNGN